MLYVALTGKPLPVRLAPVEAGTSQRVDFLDYDEPVTASAPPAASVIDLAALNAGH